jgi:hypothetical protein
MGIDGGGLPRWDGIWARFDVRAAPPCKHSADMMVSCGHLQEVGVPRVILSKQTAKYLGEKLSSRGCSWLCMGDTH